MRSLETELGRELFDRSGRLAILNAAGRELLPEARQLLDVRPPRLPRTAPGELAGSVSVGSIVSCMGTLSKVVSGLKKAHPKLDVRVLSGKASELAGRVERTATWMPPSWSRPAAEMASTRWTPLYEEELVVIAPPGAPGKDARQVLANNPFLRFDRTQRTGCRSTACCAAWPCR